MPNVHKGKKLIKLDDTRGFVSLAIVDSANNMPEGGVRRDRALPMQAMPATHQCLQSWRIRSLSTYTTPYTFALQG